MTTPQPEIDTATPAATAVEPPAAAPSTGVVDTSTAPSTASVKADKADGTGESTPTPTPTSESLNAHHLGLSREALEQEVGQVMGTLSSCALSNIKADLDKTVIQAQADFEQLRTAKVEVVRKDPEQYAAEQAERSAAGSGESLLDRLATSTTQLQATLQSTIAAAAANPAVANAAENLRLASAKENIQLSVKQAEKLAEEYLHKGDKLRKDAEKWIGEAVKVVPPAPGSETAPTVSWDGSDWYSIVSQGAGPVETQGTGQGSGGPARTLAGSRKDALLARLREDKDLVLVDPLSPDTPPAQRERFERWLAKSWPAPKETMAAEGGMAGSVRMAVGMSIPRITADVVPEHMTDDQFWQRYLYIRDTILEEDEKRQQLLKGEYGFDVADVATEQSVQQPDDFTWDDEPESTPKPAPPTKLSTSAATPSMSPRDSEESYDVVSDQAKKEVKVVEAVPEKGEDKKDDDEDSDWE